MGRFPTQKAKLEGFRFAEVYASMNNGVERHKLILAQANADLAGFFGNDILIAEGTPTNTKIGNYDDTGKYNKYLVTERITDNYLKSTSSLKNLAEYCNNMNPSDKKVWYVSSYKQLLGLWVVDNSNSRRTSPFQTDEKRSGSMASPNFPYLS